jgi:hypothetical protein
MSELLYCRDCGHVGADFMRETEDGATDPRFGPTLRDFWLCQCGSEDVGAADDYPSPEYFGRCER